MDWNTEIARELEIRRRGDLSPAYDILMPVKGLTSNPSEVGLSIATKQVTGDSFVVDGKTLSVTSVVTDESKPDRAKEIVLLDGLSTEAFKQIPIGCFLHNRNSPVSLYQDPETKACTLTRVGKQMRGREYFVQKGPMAALAEQVFQLHECGLLRGKSIGFTAAWDDYHRVPDDPNNLYGPATITIRKSSLFEISSVFVPENERSLVTEVVRKGLGSKQLLPPLLATLMPYAEPDKVWANGWTPEAPTQEKTVSTPTQPAPTETTTVTKDCKCGCGKAYDKYDNDDGQCPTCRVAALMKMVPKADDAAKALQNAERAAFYDRVVGQGIGLGTDKLSGRPTAKALRAAHDAAMFAAAGAIADSVNVEGTAERSLREFAAAQVEIAAKQVSAYRFNFGDEDLDWATVSPGEIAEAFMSSDEGYKALVSRCAEWAMRTKGWGKGHTSRITEAAKALRDLLAKQGGIADAADRKILEDQMKSLESMVKENGHLVSVQDRETDAKVKQLEENFGKLETELKTAKKRYARAMAGDAV